VLKGFRLVGVEAGATQAMQVGLEMQAIRVVAPLRHHLIAFQ